MVRILALVLALALGNATAHAQQQAKVAKIGILASSAATLGIEGVQRALRALGYIEGKNIAFEHRYADNKLDRLPVLADELVRLKVDVLLTSTTLPTLAAKNATTTIPIFFIGVGDPVQAGLIDSLARPGGNITGVTNSAPVLSGKRLELLKETVPKLSRVAVLWDARNPGSAQQWNESQLAARRLGLQVHSMEVSSADQFDSAFKEAIKAGSTALAVTANPLYTNNHKRIVDLAMKNRLPSIFPRELFVESGGLISYGPDLAEANKRAAVMVDKILKGTKLADIPVEQPTKFELMINLQTAKTLGLTISPIVLMRATRVIK